MEFCICGLQYLEETKSRFILKWVKFYMQVFSGLVTYVLT